MDVEAPKTAIISYRIIHVKTGLFFNGYDEYYNSTKGKNTLSQTNSKKYFSLKNDDNEILRKAFEGNIVLVNDIEYIRNIIAYSGSEIHKILSEFYGEYELLPVEDFIIERV